MNRPLPRLAIATALLLAPIALRSESAWAVTFEKRIVASTDDAEATNTNSMYLDSSDLELVVDATITQTVGMRWTAITIPQGATITTAWVQFSAKESHSETTNLTFVGQAADNAGTFTSLNGNLTAAVRPRTTATVAWTNVAAWTAGQTGASQRTPDLKTIVQEIVNRDLWASGNALVLIVTGSGHRTAYSFDGSSAQAPLLHVEYTTGPPPNNPPVAGLAVTQPALPPLTVNADGSTSTDTDAFPIATYRFDFGDGTPTITASAPTATASHAYAAAGAYTVTLRVTDTGNLTSTPVTRTITVQPENPPVASLAVTPVASPPLTVLADGQGSTDADLTPIATYRFDFGDGTPTVTATAPATTRQHTYASAGTYTVSLVAIDTGGNPSAPATQAATVTVTDDPPIAHLTVTQRPTPDLTVDADASASTDVDLSPIATYRFDFGDGTPTVTATAPTSTASHVYAAAGPHTVTLLVTDTEGKTSAPASQSITVIPDDPPVAQLGVSQAAFPALTANASGAASTDSDLTPIATYRFDFGDGTPTVTSNAPTATASHTYALPGIYTIALIVTDTGGKESLPATQAVTILSLPTDDPPVAQLALSQPATPARTVAADAAGSTDTDATPIQTYRFDFADGAPVVVSAPSTTASHSYATPGNKTVTVVAIDTGGNESAPVSRTMNVQQENPPTAQLAVSQPALPPRTVLADATGSSDGDLTPIATYSFNFGDGTTITTQPPTVTATHAYATPGSKTITVIATDTGGNASAPVSRTITVVDDAAPSATLTVTQQSSPALTVLASAAGSTDGDLTPIATYRFTFGDGTPTVTANAPNTSATHTYAAPGTYTVTLIATDTGGLASAPVTRSITVAADSPPVASLSVSQTGSFTVTANGSGSTDGDLTPIARYQFTWGDGASATVNAPSTTASHAYAAAGPYTVTLIATDTANLSSAPVSQTLTVSQSGTVDKRIAVGSDDAEQAANGNVNLTSGDLELVQDNSTQTVGLRFTGINVPRNAVITNAWIQFDAKESHTEATNLRVQGEAADNAATFANTQNGVSSRPRTGSYAIWPVPSWSSTAGQGPAQRTPNLAFPVQQIVNRAGWNSGNAMAFVITGSGHRTAYSYDGAATRAPLLHIEYGNGSPPPQQAPVASFTATSSVLTASVDASASTDGDLTPIASYRFQWGDGTSTTTTAPSATASHAYASPGTYTITLIVTDTANNASAPVTRTVTAVPPTPPTAGLTVTPNALLATASGSTSTAGSYPIATYRFTWGDGTPTTTATAPTSSASHAYAAPGTYTVTLVVTDTQNLSSSPATASVTVTDTPTSGTVDQRIALGSDDAEQAAGGSVSLTSSDLELVQDSSTQTVGLRFTGINIPRNATISNAYIQFDARESHSEATTLTIRGEASDNATTFTTGSNNVSNRSKTTSYGTWTPAAWSSSDGQGVNQRTPNLAFPIQQVVNRSGWNSGNAMAFIITGTGHRTAYSFEGGGSARAPLLHIDWGGAAPPQQAPVARLTVTPVGLTVTADGSASTDGDTSPIASYRFQWGDGTSATTINAPNATATHTYAVSGTYTVTLTCTDTGGRVSSPVSQSVSVSSGGGGTGIAVYAGYYSTHHPENPRPKPTPWFGSPGVIFAGVPDDGVSSGWDTSGIRIDNLGTSGLSNVTVTCDIGSHRFALWSAQNIPAGGRLILAQTGYENFDGSDTNPAGCYDCDPNDCLTKVVSTVPVVNVTIAGTTTRYYDTAQTINTEGVDAAGCPYTGGRNDESRSWVRIYPPGGAAAAALDVAIADSTGAGSDSTDAVARAIAAGPRLAWVRRPYPNPSRGRIELMFRLGKPGTVEIGVFDVAGRLLRDVSRVDLEPGDYLQQVNLAGMAPGLYYFTISTPEGKIRHPLVIVR